MQVATQLTGRFHAGNKFWKRCCKIRTKLKKTKGREPLGVYKDILDQMARADQEIAEAEMLELEAAAAADQHLVDQAGDESDDLDMEELLDDVGMNLCGNRPALRVPGIATPSSRRTRREILISTQV